MDDPASKPDEQHAQPSQADARRLTAFLRDAEAIIAAGRGLNVESRRTIQSLAKHQQLPSHLLDLAMRQLQESEQSPLKPSRYELAFVKFLDTEFEKLRSDVLSLRAEQLAIEMAQTKFQIPVERAEHLIEQRAKAAGLVRIARTDAEDYAIRFISEQIGDRQTLTDEFLESLHQRSRKLGLSTEQIDQLILNRLASNRRVKRKGVRPAIAVVLFIFLSLTILTTVGYLGGWLTRTPSRSTPVTESNPAPDSDLGLPPPSWLSTSTVQHIKQFASENPASPDLAGQLYSDDSEVRAIGYRSLSKAAMEKSGTERETIVSLICELFFEEPDSEVTVELIDDVLDRVRLDDQPIDQSSRFQLERLQQQYEANRVLAKIYHYLPQDANQQSLIEERKQRLALRMSFATGTAPTGIDVNDYLQQSASNIAVDQWNFLIKNSWSHPGTVASLTLPVSELTQAHLPPTTLTGLRNRLVQTILENRPTQWLNLKRPFRETILATDEAELINWIELVRDSTDIKFQDFAVPILLRHAKIPATPSTLASTLQLLDDFASAYRNQVLQPMILRSQQLDASIISLLESFTASETLATPDQIAQVALLTNANLAIAQRIQSGHVSHDDDFIKVDEMLQQKKIRLRDIVSLPGNRARHQPTSQPTASDINRKNMALKIISNDSTDQLHARVRALEQLESIASRFADLDYENATILARYFLETLSDKEALNIQRRISAFGDWPMLGLAIADQIAETSVSRDKALTIASLFFDQEFEIANAKDEWRVALQIRLIQAVEEKMTTDPNRNSMLGGSDWSRLSIWLVGCYRQRDAWMSPAAESEFRALGADETPAESLGRLIENELKRTVHRPEKIRLLQRQLGLIQRESKNELIQIIQSNELLFELLAVQPIKNSDSIPPDSSLSKTQKLIAQILNQFKPIQLGDQLFQSELKLLEQSARRRHQLIENSLR
jgi:hypothetical protein